MSSVRLCPAKANFSMLVLIAACVFYLVVPLKAAHASVLDGLVGRWNGDGNANDTSGTHNNGSYTGTCVPGKFGNGFDLNTGRVYRANHITVPFLIYRYLIDLPQGITMALLVFCVPRRYNPAVGLPQSFREVFHEDH